MQTDSSVRSRRKLLMDAAGFVGIRCTSEWNGIGRIALMETH